MGRKSRRPERITVHLPAGTRARLKSYAQKHPVRRADGKGKRPLSLGEVASLAVERFFAGERWT